MLCRQHPPKTRAAPIRGGLFCSHRHATEPCGGSGGEFGIPANCSHRLCVLAGKALHLKNRPSALNADPWGTHLIVCSCNVISDKTVRGAVDRTVGCTRAAYEIYHSLGYKPQCGRCIRSIKAIILDELADVAEHARAASGGLADESHLAPSPDAHECCGGALYQAAAE